MNIIYFAVSLFMDFDMLRNADDEFATGPRDRVEAMADLTPGICIDEMYGNDPTAVDTVPCTSPHAAEVFSVFSFPGSGDFPGASAVRSNVETRCESEFERYRAVANASMRVEFLYPADQTTWIADRSVVCVAVDPAGSRTGSLFD